MSAVTFRQARRVRAGTASASFTRARAPDPRSALEAVNTAVARHFFDGGDAQPKKLYDMLMNVKVAPGSATNLKDALCDLLDAAALMQRTAKYRPDQPRAPAGSREGGRWTGGGAGGSNAVSSVTGKVPAAVGKVKGAARKLGNSTSAEQLKSAAAEVKQASTGFLSKVGDVWNSLDEDVQHRIVEITLGLALIVGIVLFMYYGPAPAQPEILDVFRWLWRQL